jgi:uncharacterized membrane protein
MVLKGRPQGEASSDHFDDRRMEIIMGRLLQFGVLLASLVMLTGGLLYLKGHHSSRPDYSVFASEPQALRHFSGIVHGIAAGDASAVIQLAVLLLIATPVARVAFAFVSFGIERDKLYMFVSALVLAVLLYGFLRSQ